MKYPFFLIALLLISTGLKAQLDCKETFTMKVTAKSGLNMREQPNTTSLVMATIPFENILIACASTSGRLVIGETSGFWRQVSFEGKIGYVYDAYLELVDPALRKAMEESQLPEPARTKAISESSPVVDQKEENPVMDQSEKTMTESVETPQEEKVPEKKEEKPGQDYSLLLEAYNFCGAVEKIDPGILWYGFYPADRDGGETDMSVQPVELEIVLSKSRSSKALEFDIRTDRSERSLFMIGSTRPLNLDKMDLTDRSELMRYSNQKVFPGQQINIDLGGNVISLSATGGISSTGDCPELQNYKLMVQADDNFDLMSLLPSGQCGLPEIYWFGDLNGDQVPDFIVVSIFEDRNVFSLIISREDPMMLKAAEWSIEKCTD